VNALIDDLGGIITRRFSAAGSAIAFTIPLAKSFFRPSPHSSKDVISA